MGLYYVLYGTSAVRLACPEAAALYQWISKRWLITIIAERSEANKYAVWNLTLRMFILLFVVPSRFRRHSKARIISLGNECMAVMGDMVVFVACCVVSPVLAELRQREELFVIR